VGSNPAWRIRIPGKHEPRTPTGARGFVPPETANYP